MAEAMNDERRNNHRGELTQKLDVFNSHTDEHIGQLINISSTGFMLMTASPMEPGTILQCHVDLASNSETAPQPRLEMGAETLWNRAGSSPGHHWCGLKIIDISNNSLNMINQLLAN